MLLASPSAPRSRGLFLAVTAPALLRLDIGVAYFSTDHDFIQEYAHGGK